MKRKNFLIALIGLSATFGLSFSPVAQVQSDINGFGVSHQYFVKLSDGSSSSRSRFLSELTSITKGQFTIDRSYENVFPGYSIRFNSKYLPKVGKLNNVIDIFGSTKYAMPENPIALASPVSGNSPVASHSIETMGLTEGESKASNEGKGVTIGIVDTGLFSTQVAASADDTSSKAFRPLDSKGAEAARFKSAQELSAIKEDQDFIGKTARFINNKIPFAYDYADNDNSVQAVFGNEHGTHVASLAAGNGANYQGIAREAQLAILKVFSNKDGSAYTPTVLNALEDAAKLGLDIVNLSLGQGLIQYEGLQKEGSAETAAIDGLRSKGVIVNFAAGNDGRAAYNANSGFFADKTTTDTVEPSELGSYALYDNVNVIASSTLDQINADQLVLPDKSTVQYADINDSLPFLSSPLKDGVIVARVPGYGAEKDYEGISVSGKLAVIVRGGIPFAEKLSNAVSHGAKGIAIVNTDETTILFAVDAAKNVPVIEFTKSDGAKLVDGDVVTGTSGVIDNANARKVSNFSTDGPATDLSFNPDIAAPGENILGAVLHGYQEFSGTSMAAPNLSGAMALFLSQYADQADSGFSGIKKTLMARLQSTADPLTDDSDAQPEDKLNYASPRRQGAGLINLKEAMQAKAWAETDGADGKPSGKAKLEFKNSDEFSKGIISPSFNVTNQTDKPIQYQASVYVAVPEVRKGATEAEYEANQSFMDPRLKDTNLQTTDDHAIGVYQVPEVISVPAKSTQDVSFSFDASKAFATSGGQSALESYVSDYFPSGTFLEGYVTLSPIGDNADDSTTPVLSIPYMGFYGDYGEAPAAEAFDFEKEDGVVYNSDIQSSVMRNVQGGLPNADFGSRLYALSADSSNGQAVLKSPGTISTVFAQNPDGKAAQMKFSHLGINPDGSKSTPTAGVPGASDLLFISQFMNRTAIYGEVSLIDSKGQTIQSSYLTSYPFSGTESKNNLSNEDLGNGYPGYPLMKSFITETGLQRGYGAPTTGGALLLRNKDGSALAHDHYQLKFHYVLQATDSKGKHYEQTKVVPLDIAEKSTVAYRGFDITPTAFRIYVSDETAYVYERYGGVSYPVTGTGKNRYAEIPKSAAHAEYGFMMVDLVSGLGAFLSLTIDVTTPNGNALVGSGAINFYNDTLFYGWDFYFRSQTEKDKKSTDITLHIDDNAGNPVDPTENRYLFNPHGFAINIGTYMDVSKVQYLDPDSGEVKEFEGSVTYSYNTETGILLVDGLPKNAVTIRIILK